MIAKNQRKASKLSLHAHLSIIILMVWKRCFCQSAPIQKSFCREFLNCLVGILISEKIPLMVSSEKFLRSLGFLHQLEIHFMFLHTQTMSKALILLK